MPAAWAQPRRQSAAPGPRESAAGYRRFPPDAAAGRRPPRTSPPRRTARARRRRRRSTELQVAAREHDAAKQEVRARVSGRFGRLLLLALVIDRRPLGLYECRARPAEIRRNR